MKNIIYNTETQEIYVNFKRLRHGQIYLSNNFAECESYKDRVYNLF